MDFLPDGMSVKRQNIFFVYEVIITGEKKKQLVSKVKPYNRIKISVLNNFVNNC